MERTGNRACKDTGWYQSHFRAVSTGCVRIQNDYLACGVERQTSSSTSLRKKVRRAAWRDLAADFSLDM